MAAGFFKGASYVVRGMSLLSAPRVRRFVLIPLCVNLVAFMAALLLGFHYLDVMMERWLPDWAAWLEWLLWPLFLLLALAMIFFGFTVVTNLIAAPFNGYLAEAVEELLGGGVADAAFDWRRLPADVLSALGSELRKIAFFSLCAIPFLLLFVVPVLNVLAPPAWFLFGAWALCHEYADYPMGNHGLYFREQRRLLATRKRLSIGFGIGVMLLTVIPLVNFIAMPAAVCGATLLWFENFAGDAAAGTR